MSKMAEDAVLEVSSGVAPEQLKEFYKTFGVMTRNLENYVKGLES